MAAWARDTHVRFIEESTSRWRYGTVLRVRRGGRTVEVRLGRRVVLLHPDRLRETRDRAGGAA